MLLIVILKILQEKGLDTSLTCSKEMFFDPLPEGTWFRLVPQKELYKLARVQIDLPNALDDLWKIDVKKSHASPPAIIRERLKKIIEKIVGTSTRVYIGKGHRESSAINAFWHKESARGGIKYSINKDSKIKIINDFSWIFQLKY